MKRCDVQREARRCAMTRRPKIRAPVVRLRTGFEKSHPDSEIEGPLVEISITVRAEDAERLLRSAGV